METVHSIIGYADNHYMTRCSFFLPTAEGKSPEPTRIDTAKAQQLTQKIAVDIAKARATESGKYPPLSASNTRLILSILVNFGNIRPRGHAVVGYKNLHNRETVAGKVVPTLRLAYISPPDADSADVLIHEFTHLAGVGDVDNLSVLLDPSTFEPTGIRVLNSAWTRVVSAPVDCQNGRWDWNDKEFVIKGHFFEEAMAQLVELRVLTAMNPILDHPVIFQGNEVTFELPIEYGHCAVGWSLLLLERNCPGVVQTLIAGAQGRPNYQQLKGLTEAKFPGLFGLLYDLEPGTLLSVGVEHILYRLDPKRR